LRLFGELFSGAKQWFIDLWSDITTRVQLIYYRVTGEFRKTKNETIMRITEMYNSITKWFSDLWSSVTTTVTNLKNDVVNYFVNMKDGAIDGVQKLYDGASNLFDDVKSYASDTFDNMVQGAKELPGRIGNAIKNMASFAVDGIKSLGSSMATSLGNVVNSIIRGINKLLEALGMDGISEITINAGGGTSGASVNGASARLGRFSTGTRNGAIANDMFGMVNDVGPGNGRGGATQELIQRDGQLFAPRGKNAIVPLKKGDRI